MRVFSTVLILLLVPAAAYGQTVRESLPGASGDRALEVAAPASLTASFAASKEAEAPSRLTQVLRAVGGAAVGAWVGYLASQVRVGSWDDQSIDREVWAAGGAAVGVTLGLSLPSGPGTFARQRRMERTLDRGRSVLNRKEIEDASGDNLYEVIKSLRPEWLITRGVGSMRETPRGEAGGMDWEVDLTPGIVTIRVYIDDSFMGDVSTLKQLDPAIVGRVRFLGSAAATQRWGAGHLHGAISITTAVR